MKIKIIHFLSLLAIFSFSMKSLKDKDIRETFFLNCQEFNQADSLTTKTHDLFEIKYPSGWEHVNFTQALVLSSKNYPDSVNREFTLSVLPYQEFYLKKNHLIQYYKFQKGTFKDYDCVALIRNDLYPKGDSVFWRSEIKIVNKKKDLVYLLFFGKRSDKSEEPRWCEFEPIVNSLIIKEK